MPSHRARSRGLPRFLLVFAATCVAVGLVVAGRLIASSSTPQASSPIGDRETAAGVHWTAAGENIGEGGPVAVGSITAMAQTLTRDMLNEKPPDDGHRLNLLSKTFTQIGIVIDRDSHGVVWMTQDFSN
jgi:uncharacterized protein YkwD